MVDEENKDVAIAAETAPATPVAPVTPATPEKPKTVARPKGGKATPKKDPAVETTVDGGEAETTTAPAEAMVELRSADGRVLEASIGDSMWKGKVIQVPAHQAGDVRRLLEAGGYFLKD